MKPIHLEANDYRESVFTMHGESGQLIGILCEPSLNGSIKNEIVIMAHGRQQTRLGPQRAFVQLARDLARYSISSLRIDFSKCEANVEPWQVVESIRFDLLKVIQKLARERPQARINLLGLAEGATACLLCLSLVRADQRRVQSLVCINPWLPSSNPKPTQLRANTIKDTKSSFKKLLRKFGRTFNANESAQTVQTRSSALVQQEQFERRLSLNLEHFEGQFSAIYSRTTEQRCRNLGLQPSATLLLSDSEAILNSPNHWSKVGTWIKQQLTNSATPPHSG